MQFAFMSKIIPIDEMLDLISEVGSKGVPALEFAERFASNYSGKQ